MIEMVKRTIEIDDDLDERVEGMKEDILNDFVDWLKENKEAEEFDEYYQERGCDIIHECADMATPIYSSDIDELYYLYSSEFEEAYRDAGCGDGTEENHRQVAIFYYIENKGFDFLRELEQIFDTFIDEGIDKVIKECEGVI